VGAASAATPAGIVMTHHGVGEDVVDVTGDP
jgi:siroheme synthase